MTSKHTDPIICEFAHEYEGGRACALRASERRAIRSELEQILAEGLDAGNEKRFRDLAVLLPTWDRGAKRYVLMWALYHVAA